MPLEEFTNTYFGTSLLSATDNETWQRHHALVSPAFSDGALECVNDATVNSVKRWFKLVEKDNRRDILVDVSKLSLDVIGVAGFGHQFKPFDVSDNARTLASETPIIIRHLLSYISLPKPLRKLPIGWIARFNQALDLFSNEIQKIITEGRKNLDMNGKKDILSLLLRASSKDQEHAPLTDSELISNVSRLLLFSLFRCSFSSLLVTTQARLQSRSPCINLRPIQMS
jgi:cytochrome P450 family 3 subfamily A